MARVERIVRPDDESFRTVLGHFATGVTVVTALDDGAPVGVAANSFTSVSLDPPLVLFCVAHTSSTWPRIERAGKFAVNILGEHQEAVSRVFASSGVDRFAAVPWHVGAGGSPVLDDAIAFVDCTIDAQHRAGDHEIVVGRVVDLGVTEDARPLLYYQGRYARLLGAE